jgi:two-component system, NarL family, sensor histidine kinase UhpB
MTHELKILYLEDSEYDAELSARQLKQAGLKFSFKLVDSREEYSAALTEYIPDVILADHSLFQFNSSEALKLFKSTGLKIPFILVTGTVSEEFAVNILKEGADDYLLKSNLTRLPNAIINCLEKYRFDRERQQYMRNIITNEALMKEAEELANFGSWEYENNTGNIKWSGGVFRICGYQPGEVAPDLDIILQHIHPEEADGFRKAVDALYKQHQTYVAETRMIDKDGVHKFIFFRIIVKLNQEPTHFRLLGFMQDITEKRKLEKELADQALAQQKLITEVTIQAQERERNHLGRELHDNINQILTTSKIYLKIASEATEETRRKDHIAKSFNHINHAVDEIRKLSKSLVAPTLGDMGLVIALEELAEEINNMKEMRVEVFDSSAGKLDKNMELMFYRIAQEQLNNINKYARANHVVIRLGSDNNNHTFSIKDNGVGFDPSEKSRGIGLKNIASRVDFYSGKMDIISTPGQGCSIEIKIPF